MHYGEIKERDIANGIGVRVSLFVSGCTNRCEGCFNKQTWDFNFGEPYTKKTQDKIIELLKPDFVTGLTLLGGEPFEPKNQEELLKLTNRVKNELPQKNIWCYTGFTLERLLNEEDYCHSPFTLELLNNIDVLVDGKFEEDKKNIRLKFRGSENQRLIDMNKTRSMGKIMLLEL
mgnify:FL=1